MDVSVDDGPLAVVPQSGNRFRIDFHRDGYLETCRLEPEVEAACTCIEADELRHLSKVREGIHCHSYIYADPVIRVKSQPADWPGVPEPAQHVNNSLHQP